MRIFILLAATALVLSTPSLAASPRTDTLAISPSEGWAAVGCTPDKLCVEIAPSERGCEGQACPNGAADGTDVSLQLPGGQGDPAHMLYRIAGLPSADAYARLWPKLIRFKGGLLVGVQMEERAMYSGGGASATTLHLIAFVPDQSPFEVLRVPQSSSATIRACFSERHMKQRAGACHDEYNFDATLVLTQASAAGWPVLRYRSKATSFPGHVSRSKDSLAARPLRQRDLVTVTDPRCSYQRLFRFTPQARAYVPDTPAPDCTDYTVP
ncbi:hypothetical protein [Acidovorax sp. Leaf78]|uniref:hypothetical protein n=1 Tax=Acidovorax sp. Leaf78 TaxID=1736237 RepID=UPI000700C7E1|nr:hypothetical protein [Acidovorax sp. Leaf78]KQO19668.1 hypothetical protein ASF16_06820 [Acidovorax sp. Leaf78]